MLSRFSLTLKMSLLTIVAGGIIWFVLDRHHSNELAQIFREQILEQLEKTAQEDRLFFDQYVRSHHQVAVFILSQKNMTDYLLEIDKKGWPESSKTNPQIYEVRPPWYPKNSVMRIFAQPDFSLLFDEKLRVREVYVNSYKPIPEQLLNPKHLLVKLSHTTGMMTEVAGEPYLLSKHEVPTESGKKVTLVLASPLDSDLLYAAQNPGRSDSYTILAQDGVVLASNRGDVISRGISVDTLDDDYVLTRSSFFDYGASDLLLEFATVVPVDRMKALNAELLQRERTFRAVTAIALIVMFIGVIAWISGTVRRFMASVEGFANNVLGFSMVRSSDGDELYALKQQFEHFKDEIVSSRQALSEAVAARTRAAVERQQQEKVASLLTAVTDSLNIGVIDIAGQKPEAVNAVMQQFEKSVGSLSLFIPPEFIEQTTHRVIDEAGSARVFDIRRSRSVAEQKFVLVSDVTDSHAMQQRLEMANKVIENANDGVFILDKKGEIVLDNAACWEMIRDFIHPVAGTAGTFFASLLQDQERGVQLWNELHELGTWHGEFSAQVSSGGKRYFWLRVETLPTGNNEKHFFGLMVDVTDQQRKNEQLRQFAEELQQSNEELKKFAYIVSHDLRGPLVNIKGFISELKFGLDDMRDILIPLYPTLDDAQRKRLQLAFEEDIPEALGFVDSSVLRMDSLINAILKLSRLGRRDLIPEPLDLNAMVKESLNAVKYKLDTGDVTVEMADLPSITADRVAMEQILGNVINNAVHYLDPTRKGKITISAVRRSDGCEILIRDNGRGIMERDREKVFAIFRRGSHQDVSGEGVGLSYVQTLVRRHGGNIWFESEPNEGTVFHIFLPSKLPMDINIVDLTTDNYDKYQRLENHG